MHFTSNYFLGGIWKLLGTWISKFSWHLRGGNMVSNRVHFNSFGRGNVIGLSLHHRCRRGQDLFFCLQPY